MQVARLVVCIVQQMVCAIAGAPFVAHRIRRVLLLFDGLAASLRSRVGQSRRYLRNAERGHRGPLVRAQRQLGEKTRFADFHLRCVLSAESIDARAHRTCTGLPGLAPNGRSMTQISKEVL